VIASGGEAVVYRARQDALDRLVAIKVLVPVQEGERAWSSPAGVPADMAAVVPAQAGDHGAPRPVPPDPSYADLEPDEAVADGGEVLP
jgi:hypothetical protein